MRANTMKICEKMRMKCPTSPSRWPKIRRQSVVKHRIKKILIPEQLMLQHLLKVQYRHVPVSITNENRNFRS